MRTSKNSSAVLILQGIGFLWLLYSGWLGAAILGYGFAWGGSVPFHVTALSCAVPFVSLFAILIIPPYLREKSEMGGCAISIFLILGTFGTQALCYTLAFMLSIW